MSPRYRRADSALWRRSADAVVVLPAGTGEAFTLRGSGSALWDVLASASTVQEAATTLGAMFARPAETIAVEIEPVLQELVGRKAVLES